MTGPLRILYWPRLEPEADVLAQLGAPNVTVEVIRSVDERLELFAIDEEATAASRRAIEEASGSEHPVSGVAAAA